MEEVRVYSHEIDFWGGDLASLRARLDHVVGLGVDVLYLNPICSSYTNHGYDAIDYLEIAPWYGTRADVAALAEDLHGRGLKLVLDGVFNHLGRANPLFLEAASSPESAHRDWFDFGEQYPGGARSWMLAENLPELVHENPAVTDYLWNRPDSVVRSYLRDGVDGWRLDVASDLGFRYLEDLTNAAHTEKPGSLTVGEIAPYGAEWLGPVDGVLSWNLRRILVETANGRLSAQHAQRILARLYADGDYEHLLMSWVFVDNHDTPRLLDAVPDPGAQRLARVLQAHPARQPERLLRGRGRHDRGRGPGDAGADALGPAHRGQPLVRLHPRAHRAALGAPRTARRRPALARHRAPDRLRAVHGPGGGRRRRPRESGRGAGDRARSAARLQAHVHAGGRARARPSHRSHPGDDGDHAGTARVPRARAPHPGGGRVQRRQASPVAPVTSPSVPPSFRLRS
ncbi:alpha-amylase family glycosyl hydrolase [Salana multivorans]